MKGVDLEFEELVVIMPKDVRILIDFKGDLRNLVWLSLQDDESISVGFSDRAFMVPGFVEELVVDGQVHPNVVDLQAHLGVQALTNPHFTFHPPGYVHLRANNQDELFAGLLMIDMIVEQEGRFPWVRFLSSPVKELSPFRGVRDPTKTEFVRFLAPSDDCSIELGIDFVHAKQEIKAKASGFDFLTEWKGRTLRLFAHHQLGRKGTFCWNHES
jgi:hypothetical protein